MKKYLILAGCALLFAVPAEAQVTFTDGSGGLAPGEVLYADFNSGPGSFGNIIGSTGTGYIVQTGSNGQGADPAVGDQGDPYLSVLGGGSVSYGFGPGISSLSFDYGSADDYNLFTVLFSNGTSATYNGNDVINSPPANGNQGSALTNGRATFTGSSGVSITGVTFASTQNSLELDNFATIAAVPEPATWLMMLFGFGAIGFVIRRRPRRKALQNLAFG